ncbi:hypothetical protein BDN70DRAFT_932609 [Pholiota conissans]|uniref:BTB domain-containing protein n=1 Tax=Pholiota conissans TaxID=109636 RepID=A0A9P5Z1Z5_9AGAR|nr:hypothetical protein BDN70DRAFT_932609 [Pholiota conissans]
MSALHAFDMSTVALMNIQRDDEFYLQTAIFQVEDRLFKVPIQNFTMESEVFRTMFQLPQDPEAVQDGSTDERPILLEDVKKDDLRFSFELFKQDILTLTEEKWTSVLLLSMRWDMENLRNITIQQIVKFFSDDPHKLLIMAEKWNVESWLIMGASIYMKRESPMTEDDVAKIGLSCTLKVAALREWFLQWRITQRQWYNANNLPPTAEILDKINELDLYVYE